MKTNRKWIMAAIVLSLAGLGRAEDVKLEGQTEPAERREVASVMRGVLKELSVKEGQAIKKGDTIAELDKELQELIIANQKEKIGMDAEILYAQESFNHATKEYEKYNANPVVTQTEKDLKRIEMKSKEAYVKIKQEARRMLELDLKREELILKRMTIKSPIDGFVFRLLKSAGEAIDENQTVAIIVQTSKVQLTFFLPETLFKDARVAEGKVVAVELSTNPPMKREAKITMKAPHVDSAGHLFQVKMEMDNADGEVPVGVGAIWRLSK
jgi:RND family efflux transporter MFP subunit